MKGVIIALSGRAGSGKSAVAQMIHEALLFQTIRISFAEPMKEFTKDVFEFSNETLWGPSELRSVVDPRFASNDTWLSTKERFIRHAGPFTCRVLREIDLRSRLLTALEMWFKSLEDSALSKGLSAREVLQTLGTECGRSVHQNIWADYALRRAQDALQHNQWSAVVISDCRFLNELRVVQRAKGEVWFIDRPNAGLEGDQAIHQSETEMMSDEFQKNVDRKIDNSSTLKDLEKKVGSYVTTTLAAQWDSA